ncbi:MAG: C2H2-type zinc finger protein [Candidatus Aenigmatarchaeota archaeon]
MKEGTYSVPLKLKSVSRRKKAKKAVRQLKQFVKKRTDKHVKIDQDLNDVIWSRGMQKPPSSLKIKMVERGDSVMVLPVDKKIEEEFKCEECGKTFSTEKGLDMHVQRSHKEEESEEKSEKKEEAHECEICGKEFDTKRGLSIHQSQSHKEDEEEDYEQALSGTIGDGKKKINAMDNPDYEKLLEMEKENKDRKGMKQFLEGKLEE